MTCREFADFIADYLTNELSAESRGLFEHHLERCPNCRQYLAGYARTRVLEADAFRDENAPVPSDVPEALVRAILDAKRM